MQKETTTLNLTKEEKLSLENNLLKEQNLNLQVQSLHQQRQEIIKEFCERVSQKPANIINWNLETGIVEFKNEE